MGKKKKAPADADAAAQSPGAKEQDLPSGSVSLQAGDNIKGPPASVMLHWDTMHQLGAFLGDTVALHAPSSSTGNVVLLGAWATPRLPPGAAGLSDEVRAALGIGEGRIGLQAQPRHAYPGHVPADARLVELCATSAAESEANEAAGLHEGDRLTWLASQLFGWPVAVGCVLPMRSHGRPFQLRVVRALPFESKGEALTDGSVLSSASGGASTEAMAEAMAKLGIGEHGLAGSGSEAAGGEASDLPGNEHPPLLRVTPRTRVVIVPPSMAPAPPSGPLNVESAPATSEVRSASAGGEAAGGREVAGMADVMRRVREAIELPLKRRELFERFGVAPPTGVLLHGPPGTGKTLLARSVCAELGVHVGEISTAHLLSDVFGEAEATLARAFADARARAPAVLFLDEVDALGAAREGLALASGGGGGSDTHGRLLSLLLTEMDGVVSRPEALLVLGATNRPEALDPALRRPGRFDTEIEVGVPSEPGRRAILAGLFERTPHRLDDTNLDEAAACTAGFVGADLAALHRHAALSALGRGEGGGGGGGGIVWSDVQMALRSVRPSALREVELQIPTVSWNDIGGQAELKAALTEAVQWPLHHPEAFARMGIRPPRGVLLYGPPGCSKTLAAKALAAESRTNFLAVKGPELFSKWVGESERAVAALFRRARSAAPAIIFFDEIDALAASRGSGSEGGGGGVGARVLAQLLNEMDGVQPLTSVLVVAATNRPDLVDAALLRPGRFDSLIHVGLPDEEGRLQVLRIHTRSMPLDDDVDLPALAKQTAGYSGAELAALTREAALGALEESAGARSVGRSHLEKARATVTPRTTRETLEYFEAYARRQARGKAQAIS